MATPAPMAPASGPQATPAERIAASKAVVEPSRAAAPDSDAKLNFIVAARRAAQAAVDDDSVLTPRAAVDAAAGKSTSAAPVSRMGKHLKSILVAASVVVIIAGAIHLAFSLFDNRDGSGEGPGPQSKMSAPEPATRPSPLAMEEWIVGRTQCTFAVGSGRNA